MANALQTAKQNIINAIIANGNEEITADVLRPLLTAICDAALSITGDPDNLNTTANSNLVNAINELKAITDNLTGVVILTGTSDPNVTSPANASLGNYYARYSGSTLISFWIFNGYEWIEIKEDTGGDTFADYTDTTAMIADQANQSDQVVYAVTDASNDSNIIFANGETKLQAFYRYNGVATGSIDDYTLISVPYGIVTNKDRIMATSGDITKADFGKIIYATGTSITAAIDVSVNMLPESFECFFYNDNATTDLTFTFEPVAGWTFPTVLTLQPKGRCVLVRVGTTNVLKIIGND